MKTTLDEFIEKDGGRRIPCWSDELPAEYREAIINHKAGATQIARWLKSEGFDDVTPAKVMPLLRLRP